MKQKLLSTVLVSLGLTLFVHAQTVWNGPTISFNKASNANYTQASNQDRITSSTWLTRASSRGLFNIKSESGYSNSSPQNTEWAYGSLANYASLSYKPWVQFNGNNPPSMVGQSAVLHLKAENIYIGITFTQWDDGHSSPGGQFSYDRTTAGTPAPVKLSSFSAAKKNNVLSLNWKTASEENTASFTVERSADGREFETIGTVPATGYSSSEQSYSFIDMSPLASNFYRLRTNDNDGGISYSNIVAFKLNKNNSIDIFPNPASHVLHVQMKLAEEMPIQIMDVNGRMIKAIQQPEGDNAFTIDLDNLKAGIYFLKAGDETKQFIKQ